MFDVVSYIGTLKACSTWNNSRFGPINQKFHVEHLTAPPILLTLGASK